MQIMPKEWSIGKKLMVSLDIILSLLIIFMTPSLVNTVYGRVAVAFGFVIVTVSGIITIIESGD